VQDYVLSYANFVSVDDSCNITFYSWNIYKYPRTIPPPSWNKSIL